MKIYSSLTKYQNYIIEIKKLIRNFCSKNECMFKRQLKGELLKYKNEKFTIRYRKHTAKRRQRTNLENQLKNLERNLDKDNSAKVNLKYDNITAGIQITSKCD